MDTASTVQTRATSQFDALRVIAINPTGRRNHVRLPEYKAEDKGNAERRFLAGESGRGKGQHVGQEVSSKVIGLAYNKKGGRLNLFLTLMDKTSKESFRTSGEAPVSDRKFSWRSLIIADLIDGQRVETIEVSDNFKTWKPVDLTDIQPVFPILPVEGEAEFCGKHLALSFVGYYIEKVKTAIDACKKIKDAKKGVTATNGSRVIYLPPSGNTERLRDLNGESVAWDTKKVNRGRLTTQTVFDASFADDAVKMGLETEEIKRGKFKGGLRLAVRLELLPDYMTLQKDLKEQYETINAQIRPFELGLIEQALANDETTIELDKTVFEVDVTEGTESVYPVKAQTMIDSGKWKLVTVNNDRGSWDLIPAPAKAETDKQNA